MCSFLKRFAETLWLIVIVLQALFCGERAGADSA